MRACVETPRGAFGAPARAMRSLSRAAFTRRWPSAPETLGSEGLTTRGGPAESRGRRGVGIEPGAEQIGLPRTLAHRIATNEVRLATGCDLSGCRERASA